MVKIRRKGNVDSKVIEVPFESYKSDYENFGYELVKERKIEVENEEINREDNQREDRVNRDNRPKRK